VLEVLSAKTSAVPTRKSATRTTATDTVPVTMEAATSASTQARSRSTVTTISRRSRRSAMAPACNPNSSGGSHCSSAANDTRKGSWVWEATSSGPAAIAIPSPVLLSQDDDSSHRKPGPRREGARVSTIRLTRGQG
jgi:hypothetical protein